MQQVVRLVFLFALICSVGVFAATAAQRSISPIPGTDVTGFDYDILKGVSEKSCAAACLDDSVCRAYTFNSRAKWCFLKGQIGAQMPFEGAQSGLVTMVPTDAEISAARQKELPFPAEGLVYNAVQFAAGLHAADPAPKGFTYKELVAQGDAAAQTNPASAQVMYRQALGIVGNDPQLWLKLSDVMLSLLQAEAAKGGSTYDLAATASYAAINGFLRQETTQGRAEALVILADVLQYRKMWRETIASARASLALVDDVEIQAWLDGIVAEHGFRITSNDVDAENATPRICVNFSETLPDASTDLSAYVVVEGASQVAVETNNSQICLTGIEHGRRYAIKLRDGLPSATGETLRKTVDLNVYVPDRAPFVAFANNAYVMPSGLGGGLPITSVNAEIADVTIYRIGDRSIATAVRDNLFQDALSENSAWKIANQYGEQIWEGQVDLAKGVSNTNTITAIPVADVLGDVQPGAYVITAKVSGTAQEYWRDFATQWFIVSDLGLTAVSGEDGVHGFLRTLSGAQPVANAQVRLIALNNEVLGTATTDAGGRVDFAPGLARGTGGRAPQLLVAETEAGDYVFLDVSKGGFDLTDRGVEGRPTPGPLDLFATTERGVYRPGESVFLTALLRDTRARSVNGLPLTMEVERPDGVIASKQLLNDEGAGSYFTELVLTENAMRGAWHIRLYADLTTSALSDTAFLVEDFEPERLAFEVTAPEGSWTSGVVNEINVAAKYLYGAVAPDLDIEADAILRPRSTHAAFPGYRFGRLDDTLETDRQPLGNVGKTDEAGHAIAQVELPETRVTTKFLEAQIILRLVDTNGRAVERSLTRQILADGDRIGIKPKFDRQTGPAEDSNAEFDLIVVSPDSEIVAKTDLTWTLSRIETNYQWYREDGTWKWEAISNTREVANGQVDTVSGAPTGISAPVQWGRYRLEVSSSQDSPTSSSYEFYAGYYYAEAGSDTPDTLQVGLDKPAYRVGETAILKLEPQFAGTALVMVVDDRIIDLKAVDVPEGGTTVQLQVTDDWGPGAYVTAVLYRPASSQEKRMPSRALGLSYADVDPGDRKLDVSLQTPNVSLPRQPFTTKVKIANARAGDKVYVAVAAVDLGILNLTNFKAPDPDGWFFGQRQLGVTFRDLYGQLIDPTQGLLGALRSGGDGEMSRTGAPPPTTVLVAQHSGIVEVGADGTANVTFDMPDFSGTVRLMAMAWSAGSIGHAVEDVIVRDPVVVTLSPPRFLRLGDQTRLLVEVNNVSGVAGTYKVQMVRGLGLIGDNAETQIELETGARAALNLSLSGTVIGDHELKLIVTAPNGDALVKTVTLGVRASSSPQTTSSLLTLQPGESAELSSEHFADMVPHTGSLSLALGPVARLGVPELLLSLDRYPYGCAEQVSSRAMPLLYLNEVAQMLDVGTDDELDKTIDNAILNLLSKQNSSGGFGLWGPFSSSDLWLDSYVTEFFLRAKEEGYNVPEQALDRALDNLGNQVSYAADFTDGGEAVAYALYDLARSGRAAIGDLRYYLEARLDAFGSPLAKSQLGSALALYGDRTRAAVAFEAAIAGLQGSEPRYSERSDYGSLMRDIAGVLALAAEFTPAGVDISELTSRLATLRDSASYTSTQEDAWTLIAAAALAREVGDGKVSIDNEQVIGTAYRRYMQEEFNTGSVSLLNTDNVPLEAKISVTAIPATPPDASSNGFTITREYYLPDGTLTDISDISQNDRFVVVLSLTADNLGSGQYMVADPLPAGFEIENANLSAGSGVADLSWLSVSSPEHNEARTDTYLAAFRFYTKPKSFSTAYMVRAVTPGAFVLPGATIEDMYRPEFRANTDAGQISISPTGQ